MEKEEKSGIAAAGPGESDPDGDVDIQTGLKNVADIPPALGLGKARGRMRCRRRR